MLRQMKPKQTKKIHFRHLVNLETPLGQIYNSFSKTKKQKDLIGESLVNSLLPYVYKDENPELARESAQVCIQKLLSWVETLQLDFDLKDALPINQPGRADNVLFADRFIKEIQQLRQAFTQNSAVINELRLIRESIGKIPGSGTTGFATSAPQPSVPSLKLEAIDSFLDGGNLIMDLEEVL